MNKRNDLASQLETPSFVTLSLLHGAWFAIEERYIGSGARKL